MRLVAHRRRDVAVSTHHLLVFTNPVEGKEEGFHDWYDNVHVPDCLRTDGFVAVRRYEVAGEQADTSRLNGAQDTSRPSQRYLAAWELEGDLNEIFRNVGREIKSGRLRMSDVFTDVQAFVFTPIGPRVEATEITRDPATPR
jgi:hypothetical protein